MKLNKQLKLIQLISQQLLLQGQNNEVLVVQESKRILFKCLNRLQQRLKMFNKYKIKFKVTVWNSGHRLILDKTPMRGMISYLESSHQNSLKYDKNLIQMLGQMQQEFDLLDQIVIQADRFLDEYLSYGEKGYILIQIPKLSGRVSVTSTSELRNVLKLIQKKLMTNVDIICDNIIQKYQSLQSFFQE